jgi:hypothetical protein
MKDDADPHGGWAYGDYIKHVPIAKNDINGGLFFYLQSLLLQFCYRIHNMRIDIHVFNVDAKDLSHYLDQPGKEEIRFDRIEVCDPLITLRADKYSRLTTKQVSNICDRGYVGPEWTLELIGQLLKPKEQNPKATLLMLFLNVIGEVYHFDTNYEKQRGNESMKLIQKFIPMTPALIMRAMVGGEQAMMSSPELIRMSSCYTMFGDFDKAFSIFLKDIGMDKIARQCGMIAKKTHTIVKPWPLRITEQSTQDDFDILCGTSHTGAERYMEFERI